MEKKQLKWFLMKFLVIYNLFVNKKIYKRGLLFLGYE